MYQSSNFGFIEESQQPTVSPNYSQSIKINIGTSDGRTIISSSHRPTDPPHHVEDCRISNVEHLGDLVYVWANFFSFGSLCFVLLCSHAPAHYASTAPSTFFSLGTLVSFCLTFLTGHRGKSNLKQIRPHQNGGRSETYLKLKKRRKCMHIDSHVF